METLIKISYIKKLPNGKYRVLSEKGKNFGTYDSKEAAEKRLKQIEMFKYINRYKKIKKASDDRIDLTDIEDFSLSAVMRKLNKQLSKDDILCFFKVYKEHFDVAITKELQKPEVLALTKALLDLNKVKKIKIDKSIIKEAAIAELGDAAQVGQYLAGMIKFLMQRISLENRQKSINGLKQKLYILNESEIAGKKMPASSAIGQSITLVKHILFSHDSRYIREVINNIMRNL